MCNVAFMSDGIAFLSCDEDDEDEAREWAKFMQSPNFIAAMAKIIRAIEITPDFDSSKVRKVKGDW